MCQCAAVRTNYTPTTKWKRGERKITIIMGRNESSLYRQAKWKSCCATPSCKTGRFYFVCWVFVLLSHYNRCFYRDLKWICLFICCSWLCFFFFFGFALPFNKKNKINDSIVLGVVAIVSSVLSLSLTHFFDTLMHVCALVCVCVFFFICAVNHWCMVLDLKCFLIRTLRELAHMWTIPCSISLSAD